MTIERLTRQLRRFVTTRKRADALAVCTVFLAGLGAATLFNCWRVVSLRTIDVPAPEQIVLMTAHNEGGQPVVFTDQLQRSLENAESAALQGVAAYVSPSPMAVEIAGATQPRLVEAVGAGFFDVLRLKAFRGRLFDRQMADSGESSAVAVVSHSLWLSRFQQGQDILGATVRLGGEPVTVIGVAPAMKRTLHAEQSAEITVPLRFMSVLTGSSVTPAGQMVGRMKPDVSVPMAESVVRASWKGMAGVPDNVEVRVKSGATGMSALRERYGSALRALLSLGAMLLLLAIVNVGTLTLVANVSRGDELATHVAVGATPARVASRLAVDGVVIAALPAICVVAAVAWTSSFMVNELWSGQMPVALDMAPDAPTVAVILASGALCGILIAAPSLVWWILHGPRSPSLARRVTGRSSRGVTAAFLTMQLSLTTALVFVAILTGRSMVTLSAIQPGYEVADAMWTRLVEAPGRPGNGQYGPYLSQLVDELSTEAGVEGAALSWIFPSASVDRVVRTKVTSLDSAAGPAVMVVRDHVSAGFFAVAGVPILRGREFSRSDERGEDRVAVVSQAAERLLFGPGKGLGMQLQVGTADVAAPIRVVGISSDASPGDVRLTGEPVVYTLIEREPALLARPNVIVRFRPGQAREATVRDVVERRGWHQVWTVRTLEQQIARSLASERLLGRLSTCGALMALLIAGVGVYASASQHVLQRYREFGTKAALGATPTKLFADVMRSGAGVTSIGVLLGLPLSLWAATKVNDQLYRVSMNDPVALTTAAILVTILALAGRGVPAYRGVQMGPASLLRSE